MVELVWMILLKVFSLSDWQKNCRTHSDSETAAGTWVCQLVDDTGQISSKGRLLCRPSPWPDPFILSERRLFLKLSSLVLKAEVCGWPERCHTAHLTPHLLFLQHRALMEELNRSKKDFEKIIQAKNKELERTKVPDGGQRL